MSEQSRSNPRSRGFGASATTLIALVAVAATASALHASPTVRLMHHETPGRVGETQAIRAVAAAVADLARDLLGAEHAAGLPAPVASMPSVGETMLPERPAAREAPRPDRLLPAERLLDLPPPCC